MALMARHSREEGLVMTEIAKDTKRDSNAMRTISLVTMFVKGFERYERSISFS